MTPLAEFEGGRNTNRPESLEKVAIDPRNARGVEVARRFETVSDVKGVVLQDSTAMKEDRVEERNTQSYWMNELES